MSSVKEALWQAWSWIVWLHAEGVSWVKAYPEVAMWVILIMAAWGIVF